MKAIQQVAAMALLGTLCAVASAQYHQICYEGPVTSVNGTPFPTGIYGCAMDVPGSCTISAQSSGMVTGSAYPPDVAAAGSFLQYRFTSVAGTFTAKISFFDINNTQVAERFCTVDAVGVHGSWRGHATAGALLTGFTTDASGPSSRWAAARWAYSGTTARWSPPAGAARCSRAICAPGRPPPRRPATQRSRTGPPRG